MVNDDIYTVILKVLQKVLDINIQDKVDTFYSAFDYDLIHVD